MAKILLVEDDLYTRLGLSEILRDEGYEVEEAENATLALEKMDCEVDLLLSDLRLPDLTGLELYEKLKELYPEVTTVIMTAYSTPELQQSANEVGVFHWITKPINMDELLSILQEAIQYPKLCKNKKIGVHEMVVESN